MKAIDGIFWAMISFLFSILISWLLFTWALNFPEQATLLRGIALGIMEHEIVMGIARFLFLLLPIMISSFCIYTMFKADFLLPLTSEDFDDEIIEKYPDYLCYLSRYFFETLKYNAEESRFYGFLNPKLTFYEFFKKEKKTSAKSERNEK